MGLIEIPGFMDGVQDGHAVPQQVRGATSALDLADSAMGQPGRPQEMALRGSQGLWQSVPLEYSGNGRVAHDDAGAHEPRDECVCILERRVLPGRAVQPERSTRRI